MLLIVICLISGALKMRTSPDFSGQIKGVLMEGKSVYAGRTTENTSYGGAERGWQKFPDHNLFIIN
jgi:hypothetical protein